MSQARTGLPHSFSTNFLAALERLIQNQPKTRFWAPEKIEDATQDVNVLISPWITEGLMEIFLSADLDHPQYGETRIAIFKAIDLTLERHRNRRRVEIKPDSNEYRPTKGSGRQRKDLPRDVSLSTGVEGRFSMSQPPGRSVAELMLDIQDAKARLRSLEVEVLDMKHQDDKTWQEIAIALRLKEHEVKAIHKRAIKALAKHLKSYDD